MKHRKKKTDEGGERYNFTWESREFKAGIAQPPKPSITPLATIDNIYYIYVIILHVTYKLLYMYAHLKYNPVVANLDNRCLELNQ